MSRPRSLFLASLLLTLGIAIQNAAFAAEVGGTYSANATLANGDTWTTGTTINSGVTVTIPDLATVTYNATANQNHGGTGTLKINEGGTLLFDTKTGTDNFVVVGSLSMVNDGTVKFDAGTDLQLSTNGSSFTNNGLILKSQGTDGASNDPAYIYPISPTVGGKFTNNGDITVQAGHLNISGSQAAGRAAISTGGTFTTSTGGTLSFSGGWSQLIGTSNMSAGGSVELSDEDPASATGTFFVAMAATTLLDVDGDGLIWRDGKLRPNGNVIRNQGLLRLQGVGATLSGTSGSFLNAMDGTFRLESGDLTVNTVTLRNEGAMILSAATAATVVTLSGTGLLENATTGTITLNTGTLTTSLAISNESTMTNAGATLNTNGSFTNSGTFNQTAGTWNLTAAATNTSTGTLNFKGTTVTITGTTLTNDGVVAFIAQDGNVTLQGTGTFLNNGTFSHDYGGNQDNLVLGGTMTFQNQGTFDFWNRGDLQFVASGMFVNNGVLQKSFAGADPSYVYGNAGFTANAGSQVLSKAGTLRMASGGTSDATALWKAIGGHLDIGGTWTGTITGSSSSINSRVRITDSGNGSVASDLGVGTGGLTLNITGLGLYWDRKDILTGGNTLSNAGLFNIIDTAPGDVKTLRGGGELFNTGTLKLLSGTVTLADNSVLRNQGAISIELGGAGTGGFTGVGTVNNDTGGTLTHVTGNLTFTGADVHLLNKGTYDWISGTLTLNTGATWENQGTVIINSTSAHNFAGDGTGTLKNAATGTVNWSSGGALNINAGVTFSNDGTVNWSANGVFNIATSATFDNNGTVNWNANGALNVNTGATFDNNGIVNWAAGGTLTISTGATFRNDGTLNLTGNTNRSLSGAGTFENNGTFNFAASGANDNLEGLLSAGGRFVNKGDFNFVGIPDFRIISGYTFTNEGTVNVTATSNSTDAAQFFSNLADGNGAIFDNQGTVEVNGGLFRVTTSVNGATQFSNVALTQNDGAGTLTGGTWVANSTVNANTTFAKIDLAPFGVSSGITTIGQNAVVDLIGSTAELTQLASLTTVAGKFYVSSGKTFNATGSSFTVTSTGTVGGNGTFSDAVVINGSVTPGAERGTQTGKLTFNAGITFNAGSSITMQLASPTGTVPLDGSVTLSNISSYINGLADLDPTTEHDAIDANGTLTLNADMTISVVSTGMVFAYGQYFDLFDWTTALAGITTQAEVDAIFDLPTLAEDHEWKTELFLTKGIIYVVPEPSRALLLLGGMTALVMRRRRKAL